MDERADPSLDETAVRVPRPLIPFDSREAVSLRQAAKIAGRSEFSPASSRFVFGGRFGSSTAAWH
jgi:hypothetical protein